MTNGSDHSSNASNSSTSSGVRPGTGRRRSNPFSAALARLRGDPALVRPFLVVGIGLAFLDWVHRLDPIPVLDRSELGPRGFELRVEYLGYPSGIGRTVRPFESLIELEPLYLGWSLALYVLPLVAISAAGVVTIARALDRPVGLETVGSLFGFVLVLDLFHRLLGSIGALQELGPQRVVFLVFYFYLLVRLFLVPGSIVTERSLRGAIVESVRRTAGRGWMVFGLIVVIGLAAWLLSIPPLGAFLSSVLVAPVHAVAIVVVLERAGGGGDSQRSTDAVD